MQTNQIPALRGEAHEHLRGVRPPDTVLQSFLGGKSLWQGLHG